MIQIHSYSFGSMRVSGEHFTHDLKIIRDKVYADWWRKKGHSVSVEDIRDIIGAGPEIIILGTGNSGMMRPDPDLVNFLHEQKIKLSAVPTAKAVDLFNQLTKEGKNIAAGFHLTC